MPRVYSCPFWTASKGPIICCEGCVMTMADPRMKEDYQRRYCCAVPGWERCSIAQELMKMEEQHEQ